MREIRKKQKKLYKAMRILLYAAIAVLVVYIGAEPLVAKASHVAALVMNYVCDALVIASMFMLLMYYSKYGKVDGYLSRIEDELADAGYYLSDRPQRCWQTWIGTATPLSEIWNSARCPLTLEP